MKFKFFYVKHKITGEFVYVQYSEIDDATSLFHWDCLNMNQINHILLINCNKSVC